MCELINNTEKFIKRKTPSIQRFLFTSPMFSCIFNLKRPFQLFEVSMCIKKLSILLVCLLLILVLSCSSSDDDSGGFLSDDDDATGLPDDDDDATVPDDDDIADDDDVADDDATDDDDETDDDDDDSDDDDSDDDDDVYDVSVCTHDEVCTPPCDPLVNGDFESDEKDGTGWCMLSQGVGVDLVEDAANLPMLEGPHSGSWAAWLGGYEPGIAGVDELFQIITLPSGTTTATFACWMFIAGEETDPVAYDFLHYRVLDQSGDTVLADAAEYSNLDYNNQWALFSHSVDISGFAGQTVRVYLRAEVDEYENTNFFIDDCSFEVQ